MAIGVSVVSGGVVSTTKVCEAGVVSRLPAASVARTSKVWAPVGQRGGRENGEVHAA